MKPKGKRITITDIARESGVSKATVSRVLSNPDLVNPKTKQHILSIMEKHNYIPNHLAQGLAGTPTKTIGVIIDELSNFFFIEMAEGIDKILDAQGYSMQLSSSRWIPERETTLIKSLISSRVEGILLAPVSPSSESISILQKSGIPFTIMNCIPDDDSVSYVAGDNRRGGQIAAEYINSLNREQTILITGFSHQTVTHRIEGLKSRLDPAIHLKHYCDIKTFEEGYALVPLLLERENIRETRTMLFVTNDNVAIGIITHLKEYNVDIPGQVCVLGYDNISIARMSRVPLSTISQSIYDMGRIAALDIMETLHSDSCTPRKHLLTPELIIRQST